MPRFTVQTPLAPIPTGPISQAVVYDDFVFTAGQVGVDPQLISRRASDGTV